MCQAMAGSLNRSCRRNPRVCAVIFTVTEKAVLSTLPWILNSVDLEQRSRRVIPSQRTSVIMCSMRVNRLIYKFDMTCQFDMTFHMNLRK